MLEVIFTILAVVLVLPIVIINLCFKSSIWSVIVFKEDIEKQNSLK